MKRTIYAILAALAALALFTSCAALTPEENIRLGELTGEIAKLSKDLAANFDPALLSKLSELVAEKTALVAKAREGGFDWTQLLGYAGSAAATFFGTTKYIAKTRGPAKPLNASEAEKLRALVAT